MFNKIVALILAVLLSTNVYLVLQINTLTAHVSTKPNVDNIHSIIEQYQKDYKLVLQNQAQNEKRLKLQSEFKLASVKPKSLIYGNLDSRISLVLFGDIECPFCRKIHPELKQIVDHSKGAINWHYKHFPLSMHNPAAAHNAQTVECILETHGNQSAWIALTEFINNTKGNGQGIENIIELSRSFGLNGSLIKYCLSSDAHKDKINDDYADGRSLNITSTPSIQIIDNQSNRYVMSHGYRPAEVILEKVHHLLE